MKRENQLETNLVYFYLADPTVYTFPNVSFITKFITMGQHETH